jgi:hypothetical protein
VRAVAVPGVKVTGRLCKLEPGLSIVWKALVTSTCLPPCETLLASLEARVRFEKKVGTESADPGPRAGDVQDEAREVRT